MNDMYENFAAMDEENVEITRNFMLKTTNVSPFWGANHFMAMIFNARFILNGRVFESVEHYYQCTKLWELMPNEMEFYEKMTKMKVTVVRYELLRFLEAKGISKEQGTEWKNRRCAAVLFDSNKAKFDQNPWLKKRLMGTDNRVLVNTYSGDDAFTSGSSIKEFNQWIKTQNQPIILPMNMQCRQANEFPTVHKGKNVMGFILMELRNIYRSQDALQRKLCPNLPPVHNQMPYPHFHPSSYFLPPHLNYPPRLQMHQPLQPNPYFNSNVPLMPPGLRQFFNYSQNNAPKPLKNLFNVSFEFPQQPSQHKPSNRLCGIFQANLSTLLKQTQPQKQSYQQEILFPSQLPQSVRLPQQVEQPPRSFQQGPQQSQQLQRSSEPNHRTHNLLSQSTLFKQLKPQPNRRRPPQRAAQQPRRQLQQVLPPPPQPPQLQPPSEQPQRELEQVQQQPHPTSHFQQTPQQPQRQFHQLLLQPPRGPQFHETPQRASQVSFTTSTPISSNKIQNQPFFQTGNQNIPVVPLSYTCIQ